jgi:hypothetical protein
VVGGVIASHQSQRRKVMTPHLERISAVIISVIAGILICNVTWVAPTAATWGGGWNIAACIFFSAIALGLIIWALLLPKDGTY